MRFAGHSLALLHIFNSLPSASSKPSSHHRWRTSHAWDHEEFLFLMINEDVQGPGFCHFFLVSRFGVIAPTDTGVDMDLGAREIVDWNGACSLGHLGYGFRLHSVALSLLTNPKSPSQSTLSSF